MKQVQHKHHEFNELASQSIGELLDRYPFIEDFFIENRLNELGVFEKRTLTFTDFLANLTEEQCEAVAVHPESAAEAFFSFVVQMKRFLSEEDSHTVHTLTILPGTNKSGIAENFTEIKLHTSQVIAIVGPTGSGKSRLLADIEWAAQQDTPTCRTILINDELPDTALRFSPHNKLVAQLSQNMNFVMDLSVEEFICLHAESRTVKDKDAACRMILEAANRLAGEQFLRDTAITALSGGQSRALMIADTAILSSSPIVLIDEIENAGIDRKKALDLLVSKEKIVLMATHDPALALYADRRIIIKNGGISAVLETTPAEKTVLQELEEIDAKIHTLRAILRSGGTISSMQEN